MAEPVLIPRKWSDPKFSDHTCGPVANQTQVRECIVARAILLFRVCSFRAENLHRILGAVSTEAHT